ncbi:hypothetical protein SHLO109777_06560 [Shewanella loihica]|uniref:Uncharacterized protein n=1 Tax=Shewanella loihica (strain ATCC BAA-1088 / PV-4) TaxID=323850 RepID=A3QH09_SHELP|nr:MULTISPECIES: hypothetical protein [Shewanella]ABO24757.1 conserved hypothetical protein [Shewanella loihica PV-4]QYJ81557.1 hypothetical protein K0H80_14755 [Shewanella aegiceratis]QYJ92914.1 hypothetical protein K0I31_15040 [Shewanella spartinae]QYJ96791.1 hypothetical protein K0J45_14830 [Shewanella alkalitolerans]QYK12041.1 hypothetical protein K0I63_14955 [Shewanella rhizosphaerae]
MTPNEFIDNKAPQLAQYGKAFLNNQLDFNEIQLYLWDTLEEWAQFNHQGDAQTDIERVFWHLIHAFDRWPDWTIRGNQFLRKQIDDCCDFLSLGGTCPSCCVGTRPSSMS